jgi:tetratricopeptide (TPR) repeat protein
LARTEAGQTASDPEAAQWLEAGAALEERGEYEDAIRAYEEALELAPGDTEALVGLASAYESLDERDVAIAHLQEAAQIDPEDAHIQRDLGRLYCLTGDGEACLQTLENAVRLDPESARGRFLLGLAYQQHAQNGLDRALQEFREALRLDPDNAVTHMAMADLYTTEPGYEPLAIEAYQEAARLAKAAGEAEMEARAYAGLARIYYQVDEYEQCIETWQHALEIDAENPDAYRRLGLCYSMRRQEGDLERAVNALETALVLDYGQVDAYYFILGQYYATQDDMPRAMLAWDQFLRFSNDEERNAMVRGWMERYQQALEEAGP